MHTERKLITILIASCIVGAVYLLFPAGSALLTTVRSHWYVYPYWGSVSVEAPPLAEPALAVPILMYHGVIQTGPVGPNTSREDFVAEMELLKKHGYETISVAEYDLFRQGKFTLPPKPIIITFDDGRKDSFYTVDAVLERLGFKATIFIATIRANTNDPFYLSWDELREIQKTGRWEIEAHGRRSHEQIPADAVGNTGTFLTTREYLGDRLESVEAYERRVDADYVFGIEDLKNNLGVDARYFAVPFSDYGGDDTFEYSGARAYNEYLTQLYFRLAFVETSRTLDGARDTFYNYQDSDPHTLRRLEVGAMKPEDLLASLERFAPKPPRLVYQKGANTEALLKGTRLLYGRLATSTMTLSTDGIGKSARLEIGDWGWRDYAVSTRVGVSDPTSHASIFIHYLDEDNFVSATWAGTSLRLIEVLRGREREIAYVDELAPSTSLDLTLSVYRGRLSVRYGERWLVSGVPVSHSHGASGFGVWSKTVVGAATLEQLSIEPLQKLPREPMVPEKVVTSTPTIEVPPPVVTILQGAGHAWSPVWGAPTLTDDQLTLAAEASTTGSGVSLIGSNEFSNFTVESVLDWYHGRSYALLARYQDEDNYVACTFARYGSGVRIEAVHHGEKTSYGENYTLGEPYYSPWLNNKLGMRIRGTHVECLKNGEWILRADVPRMPPSGALRLEVWDKDPGVARLVIKKFSVIREN